MEPAAEHVTRSLSRSFALHVAARALEASSVGFLAGALVAATITLTADGGGAAHDGSVPATADLLQASIAALLCGACTAASWWLEHAPRRDEHVRRVDRELALDGALVTSDGIAATARTGTLEGALVGRVAARLSGRDVMRAALPRTPLLVLAALAGAALLFAVQESRPVDAPGLAEARAAAARALSAAAAGLRAAASETPAGARPDGTALAALADGLEQAARARTVGRSAGMDADPDARAQREAMAELEGRVSAARSAYLAPAATQALDRARSAIDQALWIDAGPRSPGAAPDGDPGKSPVASSAGANGSTTTGPPLSGGALASAAAQGRMSAPNADPRAHAVSPATGPAAGPLTGERGVGATRWWPPAYDAVVERWLADSGRDEDD